MTKEERREYNKQYHKKHKEKIKDYMKKYYENNKEKLKDYMKKYYKNNKKYYKNKYKKNKKYYKEYNNKNYERFLFLNRIYRYFSRKFSRYISLENYLTIMKLKNESLKRSLMIRLGKGYILEEEAVALSGMTFTEEDRKILTEYLKKSYNHWRIDDEAVKAVHKYCDKL